MAGPESQRTNLPAKGARIEPRGYHLGLAFHPAIRLERKKGLEFAVSLADYLDPDNIRLEGHMWTFTQPAGATPRSSFRVLVQSSQIQTDAEFPTHAKEWFEERQQTVLEKFGEHFRPKLILQSAAMIRGVMQIDGDARTFLAKHVMKVPPTQFAPFRRPIHVIGLRLLFPPFTSTADSKTEITDWLVDIKAESLAEDPSKLLLEADAQWPGTSPWDRASLAEAIGRLTQVSQYLEKNVAEFLRRAAGGEPGDE